MKKAIGIDLGTTNSVIAFRDTSVRIIRNRENEELTRSCVAKRKGEIIVGKNAYMRLGHDPSNTILSIKRLMGGAIKDQMVQDMMNSSYYKYKITELTEGTEDAVAVVLDHVQYTPEQISAEILKKLKQDAEINGEEVTHAVISVPAYFTEKQRNATIEAAQMAGLKVQKLIAEPTAAAISYGVDNLQPGESKIVLVYDFGGGTFDISILNIIDGKYIEAGTGGDRWLGGDDIDRKLWELILKKVASTNISLDLDALIQNLPERKKFEFEAQMRFQTEAAKIQLSSSNSGEILIDNILEDENGDFIDIDISISKKEFETLVKPFIDRTIELIDKLLIETGYDISMIDNILLVGGTSSIPLLQEMLRKKYGANKVKVSERPMLAIAEGAAILSHRLGDESEDEIISCASNHNYFIELIDDSGVNYQKIIEKQTPLPSNISKTFRTSTNNQKIAKVAIYADVEDGKREIQFLGFYLIEENLPMNSELVFNFQIDQNEKFNAFVYPKSKREQSKQVILGRGMADQRALKTIDELVEKSVKEFRTIDGEEEFLEYIKSYLDEIDRTGAAKVSAEKWHEIYFKIPEKFEEIKRTEVRRSHSDVVLDKAKELIMEFGDLIDPFDRNNIIRLINQLDSLSDESESALLAEQLEEKIKKYNVLSAAANIESLAARILEIPGTGVASENGLTNKRVDVERLNQLSREAKTNFNMHKVNEAIGLVSEAYSIIHKYKEYL